VYIAWDAASGGSIGGGIRVAASSDHGVTFTITRADNPQGPGRSIGTSPFVGPDGPLYVAWNDFAANAIVFNRSFDGGASWDQPVTISSKVIPFDIAIPAENVRRALVYPSCDADRSGGAHRGRLYGPWMDLAQRARLQGLFPCPAINYGNQQGDYEGLVSFGGVSHPIWTDSRRQLEPASGCRRPFLMEEVFTATVQ
jgi:hypothetical protein